MTNLTDEKRKELTLFLGEKWEEIDYDDGNCHCELCQKEHWSNRFFVSPDDMVALVYKLGRDGQWREFYEFCFKPYVDDNPLRMSPGDMCLWLMSDPARFCWLVSEFLTKTEVKDA